MFCHGVESFSFLYHLLFEVGYDLRLHAHLDAIGMFGAHVAQKRRKIRTTSLATYPAAQAGLVKHGQVRRRRQRKDQGRRRRLRKTQLYLKRNKLCTEQTMEPVCTQILARYIPNQVVNHLRKLDLTPVINEEINRLCVCVCSIETGQYE